MAEIPARYGPTLLSTANTSQTILTTGAAGTWVILRDITIVNETTGAVIVTYGIGTTNADAAGKRLLPTTLTMQPGSLPYTWGGFIPLFGGASPELLYAVCNTTNGATITVAAVAGP